MTAPRDKYGRPIVVVTGMGIVTSLGAGKTDNWAKLTAGESGIKTVSRFPIDGLKTTMAGAIDFVTVEPFSSTSLSERLAEMATEEALEQSGIGSKGDFPGPLFLAVAPVETEWPQRLEVGRAVGKVDFNYFDLLRISGGGKFAGYHHRFMFGSVASHLAHTFGTNGSPIALHRLRIGRNIDPARRRGDPPGRGRCGALRCDRWLGQSGSDRAILPAVGAIDPERPAAGRFKALLQEPGRLRHGGRRRSAGAGKL
jgi:hypothetical protein